MNLNRYLYDYDNVVSLKISPPDPKGYFFRSDRLIRSPWLKQPLQKITKLTLDRSQPTTQSGVQGRELTDQSDIAVLFDL
ncbi:MAG TPA: hypothetical protein V6C57_16725 [Coleofasciculaceae cyanobacterium]